MSEEKLTMEEYFNKFIKPFATEEFFYKSLLLPYCSDNYLDETLPEELAEYIKGLKKENNINV
jgi:hypothetical protein